MSKRSGKAFSLPVFLERFKGAVDEVGYSLLGDDFEGFVDREIRSVTAEIKLAKERKEEAKANRVSAKGKLDELKASQQELEEQVLKLLRGHRKAQAREISAKVAQVIAERSEQETRMEAAAAEERQQQVNLEQLERKLKLLKMRLGAYKAAATLQRTQDSLTVQPGAAPAMPETALKPARRLRQGPVPEKAPETGPPETGTETAEQVLNRLEATLKKPTRNSRKSSSTGKSQ